MTFTYIPVKPKCCSTEEIKSLYPRADEGDTVICNDCKKTYVYKKDIEQPGDKFERVPYWQLMPVRAESKIPDHLLARARERQAKLNIDHRETLVYDR